MMKNFLRRILVILSTTYILIYYSEFMFWARYKPADMTPLDLLVTYSAYCLAAFIFLFIITKFQVRTIWALFLAGSVYGWLIEGVIVQTAYEDLPLSISFTGLAWHALISVIIGWYYVRKVLLENSYRKTIRTSLLIGLFYGLWSICWWVEDGVVTPLSEFSSYIVITSIVLIISYWIHDKVQSGPFHPQKIGRGFAAAIAILFFIFVVIQLPIALVILPPLLVVVYAALRRNRKIESREDLITALQGSVKPLDYVLLLFIPLTAIAVYSFSLSLSLLIPTNWIVYIVTTPLGFIMLILSIVKIFRRKD